ncbi:YceD family protein [Commensalibacter oyaizuii]|uniref:DUF177 domain-containing protein n=1 Tax=Commensalibacter oyaizuii TaxID=3043873 RepID=A0ABT6PZZ0_9PROT|nr:DUF177 domain-containing protein [Commensalibacter sp. TBRC 16381]MDI2090418.1 DUF177 domain-containing protein [Commensalibacter sp. TBRC 16381]
MRIVVYIKLQQKKAYKGIKMKACCEFSRKVALSQIQKKPLTIKVEADEEEKKKLATRFFIPKIHSLTCTYQLKYYHGAQIRAKGKIEALVTQNCVISLEDFFVTLNDTFELLFLPLNKVTGELEEIDDPDVIPYDNDMIDLGEVTAEQLALFLDPYPHKSGADNPMIYKEDDSKITEKKAVGESPFKILEKLKKK